MKATRMIIVCVVLLAFPTKSMNGTARETYNVLLFIPAPQPLYKTVPYTIEEQILAVLIDSGFSICEQAIILAQSKHESGYYTNSLSRTSNNVFSLHKRKNSIYVLSEKVRAEGCTCFAIYRSVQDATRDYLQYRDRLRIPKDLSVEEYVAFIKRKKYFTDNEVRYLSSLKQLIGKDDAFIHNFNERYPGCPVVLYSNKLISTHPYPALLRIEGVKFYREVSPPYSGQSRVKNVVTIRSLNRF
jgi:hypothetical protein